MTEGGSLTCWPPCLHHLLVSGLRFLPKRPPPPSAPRPRRVTGLHFDDTQFSRGVFGGFQFFPTSRVSSGVVNGGGPLPLRSQCWAWRSVFGFFLFSVSALFGLPFQPIPALAVWLLCRFRMGGVPVSQPTLPQDVLVPLFW